MRRWGMGCVGLAACALQLGCGGDPKGGDDADLDGADGTDGADGGEGADTGGPLAPAVTAQIGREGGTISAPDGRGATLTLEVPPGALLGPVDLTLRPLGVVDGAPAYALSPAGLSFAVAPTLRLTSAALPAGASLQWVDPGGVTWLASAPVGDGLEATPATLGLPGGSAPAARADGEGEAELRAAAFDCAADYEALTDALSGPIASGDVASITRELEGLRASASACPSADIERRQALACARYDATVTSHRALAVTSFEEFTFVAGGLARAHDAVVLSGGACDLDNFTPLLAEKFDQMVTFLGARYTASPFSDDVVTHLDEIDVLFGYQASCLLVGVDEDTCASLRGRLYPEVLDRLRAAAWGECRATGVPTGPAAVIGHRPAGVETAAATDPFMGVARFTVAEAQRDAATCTGALELRVFDDADVPEEIERLRQPFGAGAGVGSFPPVVRTQAPPTGALSLRGALRAETCDGATAENGALVARVGGVELGRLAAVRGAYPLDTAGLHVDVPEALAAAGLDPAVGGTFDLVISREDGGCPLYAWPDALWTLRVEAVVPKMEAELWSRGRTYLSSSIAVTADCDADDGTRSDTDLEGVGGSPVPTTLTVPGASLQVELGAALTATWTAELPGVTDTCADGSDYEEPSTAVFVLTMLVTPLEPMEVLLSGPAGFATLDLATWPDRDAALAGVGGVRGTDVAGGITATVTPPQVLTVGMNGSARTGDTWTGSVITLAPVSR